MCGRFTLTQSSEAIATEFQTALGFAVSPRYNIAPSQPVLVILKDDQSGKRYATHLVWGLIPSWAKDPAMGRRLINARAETVAEKPSFRAAFRRRRCLIPMDGFYEWKAEKSSKRNLKPTSSRKPAKQPFHIHVEPDQSSTTLHTSLSAFAGIWEHWQSPDGSDLYSCAVLTMPANPSMQAIHHRMPVMLAAHQYEQWLDLSNTSVQPFVAVSNALQLCLTPVNSLVNNPGNEHPDCMKSVEESS